MKYLFGNYHNFINMKSKISILFCIVLIGCSHSKEMTYNKHMKESFLEEFKVTYFKKLMSEAFNKSPEIKTVLFYDKSGYSEPILSLQDMNLIDSLVKMDNQTLVKDSINRIGHTAEGSQGKHIFSYALYKIESKWMDSLAKARAKIFMKSLKEQ